MRTAIVVKDFREELYRYPETITFEKLLSIIEKWRIKMMKNYITLHVHCPTCPKGFKKLPKQRGI